jgi:Secretion system C-terminal sorting domain
MKGRLMVIAVLWLCSFVGVSAQPNINVTEYFVDTDPGIDAGTKVGVKAYPTIQDLAFSTSLTSLSVGMHQLYFRIKDANGFWSVTERTPFYNLTPTIVPAVVNITNAEYFIDADPGIGAATAITVTAGVSISNLSLPIDIASLSEGFHKLFVRVRDANGLWSATESSPFYKLTIAPLPTAASLTNAEYFIDNDPGTGNAIAVTITTGLAVTDLLIPVNVSTLSDGNHKLFVRFKNANGQWSVSQSSSFSICNQAIPVLAAATSITTSGFTANWAAASGATSYYLDVSADNFTTFVSGFNNLSVSATTKQVVGLSLGTAYKYRVSAVNANCTSLRSTAISIATLFTVPTASVATAVSTVGFTANWASVIGATGYQLDISSDNFATFITGYNSKNMTSTSEVVTGLASGTTYQYRVRATNGVGTSASSNIISTTTTATILAAPVATAASNITSTTFAANWNNVPGATGYLLDVSTDNFATFIGGFNSKSVAGTTQLVTGLSANTVFKYRVRATNTTGTSSNSNSIDITTLAKQNQVITFIALPDRTFGDVPFSLSATSSSSLAVTFTPTSDKITISSGQVTLVKAGSATINANQAGNDSFNAAPQVSRSFCINPPKPTITITNANTETPTLTSNATVGNQWYFNGVASSGATNATLNVVAAGIYKVQVIVDGCSSDFSADFPIIVTGDLPLQSSILVAVYPNPVENYLEVIGLKGDVGNTQLVDATGRTSFILLEKSNEAYRASVSHLAAGFYLLRVQDNTIMRQIKFIKK